MRSVEPNQQTKTNRTGLMALNQWNMISWFGCAGLVGHVWLCWSSCTGLVEPDQHNQIRTTEPTQLDLSKQTSTTMQLEHQAGTTRAVVGSVSLLVLLVRFYSVLYRWSGSAGLGLVPPVWECLKVDQHNQTHTTELMQPDWHNQQYIWSRKKALCRTSPSYPNTTCIGQIMAHTHQQSHEDTRKHVHTDTH